MSQKPKIPKNFPATKGRSIIILPAAEEQKTASGLLLANTESSAVKQGYIMAVGANLIEEFIDTDTKEKRTLKPGDKVLYNTYLNSTIIINDCAYLCGTEMDAYVIFPKDDTGIVTTEKQIKKRKRGFDGHDGVTL